MKENLFTFLGHNTQAFNNKNDQEDGGTHKKEFWGLRFKIVIISINYLIRKGLLPAGYEIEGLINYLKFYLSIPAGIFFSSKYL